MINIIDYAVGGYLSSPYATVNTVMEPANILDTLGGTATADSILHNWNTVFNALLLFVPNGETLFFPATYQSAATNTIYADYPIQDTLKITSPVILCGDGHRSTIIKYAASINASGIEVLAGGVILEHFQLNGLGGGGGIMQHGLLVRSSALIRYVHINNAAINGVHIEEGANGWQAYHVMSNANAGAGFFTAASFGVAIGLDINGNNVASILDESTGGNTYVGCHTAGLDSATQTPISYKAGNGIFLGCYAEFDQLAPQINKPAIWIGAESKIPTGNGTVWKDNTFYIQNKHGGVRFENKTDDEVDFTAGGYIPGTIFEFGASYDFNIGNFDYAKLDGLNTEEKTIDELRKRYDLYKQLSDLLEQQIQLYEKRAATTNDFELKEIDELLKKNEDRKKELNSQILISEATLKDTPNVGELSFGRWRLEFNPETEDEYNKWYQLRYYITPPPSGAPAIDPPIIHTALAFSSTLAHAAESVNGYPIAGNIAFPRGFFIGSGQNRIKIGVSGQIPEYEAKIGDIIFNTQPEIGEPAGWVYAAIASGGSAWKSFGEVGA